MYCKEVLIGCTQVFKLPIAKADIETLLTFEGSVGAVTLGGENFTVYWAVNVYDSVFNNKENGKAADTSDMWIVITDEGMSKSVERCYKL